MDQNLLDIDVLEVASQDLTVSAAQVPNEYTRLVYPFRFRGNTHRMLLETGADRTMISQRLADQYHLNRIAIKVRLVRLANSHTLTITHEATTFSVRLGELHASFAGPIMPGLNHDVIAMLDWMGHNRPYIDWDTSVITLARNGVGFQLYPAEMHKLLKDTVFVR